MYTFFVDPSVDGYIVLFHILATMNSVAVNMAMQIFL